MLQQALKLLPLTKLELTNIIQQELIENPLLEEEIKTKTENEPEQPVKENKEKTEDDFDWDSYIQQSVEAPENHKESYDSGKQVSWENFLEKETTLIDHLLWQLGLTTQNEEEKKIGNFIIGNLESDGYLRLSLEEIIDTLQVKKEDVEKVLAVIQTFDPIGIAARDLKECLNIQIKFLGLNNSLADTLINQYLDQLEKKHYPKIAAELNISVEDIINEVNIIKGLNPVPGNEFLKEKTEYITPDIVVVKTDNEYKVIINDSEIPQLKINSYYQNILKDKNTFDPNLKDYVKDKFRSAIWFIKSIEQRRQTLYKTACSIVNYQTEFLERGRSYVKPMILKNVAQDIEMHESTISRIIRGKYMNTPQGIFELKYFFHSSIQSTSGESISSLNIKEKIRKIVNEEDPHNPLTDQRIEKYLLDEGIKIARRTITKYRKELKIPSTSQRKNN